MFDFRWAFEAILPYDNKLANSATCDAIFGHFVSALVVHELLFSCIYLARQYL